MDRYPSSHAPATCGSARSACRGSAAGGHAFLPATMAGQATAADWALRRRWMIPPDPRTSVNLPFPTTSDALTP